ncbi:MAG: serine hydrolase [Sphingomonadales bacterium]|nr:serine hydrolase [Sphingomonadales bacterium]MDE2168972.1 serine hydrolase [Sphingomonadales bacterium]
MRGLHFRLMGLALVAGAIIAPPAMADDLQQAFDKVFGTGKTPVAVPGAIPNAPSGVVPYGSGFEARLAAVANASHGRIGVAAVDLSNGKGISVMGDQPFPMASTVKIAIVATFLDGVDQGKFRLTDRLPIMMPRASRPGSGPAPQRPGALYSATTLIDMAIIHSNNHATDALLAAIGGPQAVDRWLRKAGVGGIRIDRDIATLVRDDGMINPATTIDLRDSATPQAMATLLAGLYQGQWLSPGSREVLMSAMRRCATGSHRIRGLLPNDAIVGHKTGTLNNTSSDVGIIRTADGRNIAIAIYVTGQGSKPGRDSRIATIARTVYEGYQPELGGMRSVVPIATR